MNRKNHIERGRYIIIKLKDVNPVKALAYKKKLGVSIPMAQILSTRVSLDTADKLINDPTDLLNASDSIYGVDEVAVGLSSQDNIYIFADYDVDGLMSGFILNDFLDIIGKKSHVHYPSRKHGYGLNLSWAKWKVRKNRGKKFTVVTVDNGITAFEAIDYLREHGVPVYVIDHHEPADKLPDAVICDPWVDPSKGGTYLCGAAVVWKVIIEMAFNLGWSAEEVNDVVLAYLPYVATATISDVMPASEENYAIVQEGLRMINRGYASELSTLMDTEGIESMRTKDIAWTISPELNACSRMNRIELAAKFFSGASDLKKLAREIKNVNNQRKEITEKAINGILSDPDILSNGYVVLADCSKYPTGIMGIIAGKLSEKTGRPAIAYRDLGDGIGGGSARAPQGVDIKSIVNYEADKGNAISAMGHSESCGVNLYLDKINSFQKDIIENLAEQVPGDTEDTLEEPEVLVDTFISPDDMCFELRHEINSFGYTSKDIPLIGIHNVEIEVVPWETRSGKKHAIFRMKDKKGRAHYAVAWNGLDDYVEMGSPSRMNFAGSLDNGAFCAWCKNVNLDKHSTILTIDVMEAAE